jgi:flagellin-specific chaperone FliS
MSMHGHIGTTVHHDEGQAVQERRTTTTMAVDRYQREQLLNLNPVEVIRKLYDIAIVSCKKGDGVMANKAINELIVALNFDYQDMSIGLFRLYDYSKRCVKASKYPDALVVLEELRATWVQAFHL